MPSAELIVDLASLERLESEWDELAVACALPLMTPGLMVSWWRYLAPAAAEPRTVAVREDGKLIGIAPFYVAPRKRQRIDYRLPGIELGTRLSPLAVPGREGDVARLVGETLLDARPRPDVLALEGHAVGSPWPLALRSNWPGAMRPIVRQYLVHGAPTISLREASYEEWLAGKSSNFRSQMRRATRQLVAAGGLARISTRETLDSDIDAFVRLHSARWEGLGRSNIVAIADRLPKMLRDLAATQIDSGRFRLWMLDVDGEAISAQLFLAAGGEVAYVNGGWDEQFARLKPAMLGILYAIEDAFARDENRIDLGGGEQPYKLRFADGNDPVAWTILMAPGRRLPLTVARLAPMLAQEAVRGIAKRSLSPQSADRVRRIRNRARRTHG